VPATALYVAERIDGDDRVTEAIRLANKMSLPLLEAPRPELDRIADGLPHQGLVLQVPPYEYANADDLLERAGKADPLITSPTLETLARSCVRPRLSGRTA
jgi:23S rRNA (guanosine2251-2'-O)-methyltransferase